MQVIISPPTQTRIIKQVSFPESRRAGGQDGRLSPSFFKNDGEVLASQLTKFLGSKWVKEQMPKDWYEPVAVPIYKEGDKSPSENHGGLSLAI